MKQRNSAIEMLRILSMMMVLMVHFVGATFGLPTREQLYALDSGVLWKDVLESLSIVGVNCFVLISGYYGIKATRRRLLDFTLGVCLPRCLPMPADALRRVVWQTVLWAHCLFIQKLTYGLSRLILLCFF